MREGVFVRLSVITDLVRRIDEEDFAVGEGPKHGIDVEGLTSKL